MPRLITKRHHILNHRWFFSNIGIQCRFSDKTEAYFHYSFQGWVNTSNTTTKMQKSRILWKLRAPVILWSLYVPLTSLLPSDELYRNHTIDLSTSIIPKIMWLNYVYAPFEWHTECLAFYWLVFARLYVVKMLLESNKTNIAWYHKGQFVKCKQLPISASLSASFSSHESTKHLKKRNSALV